MNYAINELRRSVIAALDLGPIKFKLLNDSPETWSLARLERVETLYRRFLFLIHKHPDETLVPSEEIDSFWHAHILDTRKYAADMEAVFGEFLHHYPYFGLRGDADAKAMDRAFERSIELYGHEFGTSEPHYAPHDASAGRVCGGKCKSLDEIGPSRPAIRAAA